MQIGNGLAKLHEIRQLDHELTYGRGSSTEKKDRDLRREDAAQGRRRHGDHVANPFPQRALGWQAPGLIRTRTPGLHSGGGI